MYNFKILILVLSLLKALVFGKKYDRVVVINSLSSVFQPATLDLFCYCECYFLFWNNVVNEFENTVVFAKRLKIHTMSF